jgi:hypothetical protein
MTNGTIHEISETLGRLAGTYEGLKELIISNHLAAEKKWDHIGEELTTIKHDQRGLERQNSDQSDAMKRMGDKLRPLEDLPGKIDSVDRRVAAVEVINARVDRLDERLGLIERVAYKLAGIGAAAAAGVTLFGYITLHYGRDVLQWLGGRT